MNHRFRRDVGVEATDEELLKAVNQLPDKLRNIIVLCYALFGGLVKTTQEVARRVLNQTTGEPVSAGYVRMLRDKGLRYIRYYLTYLRAEKHPSGIPLNLEFWMISNRSKRLLERRQAKTVEQVLRLDFRWPYMSKSVSRELITYLGQHGLAPISQVAA